MRRPLGQPLRNEDVVHAVAFSPDGERLLTGSDNAARLWSVTLGKTIAGPLRHKEKIDTLAFSLDGKQMLTGSFDQTAIWDAVTGKSLGKPIRHADPGHAAMRPDGKTLLIGSDRTAQLWDPVTGKPIGKPMLHEDSVFALAFGPHGKTVVTGSHDKMARLWDADTSRLLCEPLPHDGGVWRVAFAPDGTTVLTGCQDGTAQLWDVSTGRFLGERIGNRRHRATAFSVDGTTVLTAGLDGTARLWKTALLPPDEPKRLRVWVSVITGKASMNMASCATSPRPNGFVVGTSLKPLVATGVSISPVIVTPWVYMLISMPSIARACNWVFQGILEQFTISWYMMTKGQILNCLQRERYHPMGPAPKITGRYHEQGSMSKV